MHAKHFASYKVLEDSKMHRDFLSYNPQLTCTLGSPWVRTWGQDGQTRDLHAWKAPRTELCSEENFEGGKPVLASSYWLRAEKSAPGLSFAFLCLATSDYPQMAHAIPSLPPPKTPLLYSIKLCLWEVIPISLIPSRALQSTPKCVHSFPALPCHNF